MLKNNSCEWKHYILLFDKFVVSVMESGKFVTHKGIIQKVYPGFVSVKITSVSACQACHAKEACNMADTREKEIEVAVAGSSYHRGEPVQVILKKSLGYKAVLLAYLLPVLVFISTLMVTQSLAMDELRSGLVSLSALALYFTVLFYCRHGLKNEFKFVIKKLTHND